MSPSVPSPTSPGSGGRPPVSSGRFDAPGAAAPTSDPASDPVSEPAPQAPPTDDADPAGRRALDALRAVVEPGSSWSDRVWEAAAAGFRANPVAWGLGALVVLVLLLAGLAVVHRASPPAPTTSAAGSRPGASTATEDPAGGSTSSSAGAGLVVQVAGAVAHPGVYHLSAGARVGDLLTAAGGLATDADGDRVNQAASLSDGTLIYIPHVGQTDLPDPVDGGGASAGGTTDGSGTSAGADQPAVSVDINTATADQLDALPGVGPATAAAIIAYRRQHGPFHQVDDLAQVAGIGPAKLAQIRPHAHV